LSRSLYGVLVLAPAFMAAIAVALSTFGGAVIATAVLLAAWGLATCGPVGWGVWISRTLPRDAETAGGLMVATIQFAITLGATIGGLLFDAGGYQTTFLTSAGILLAGAMLAYVSRATSRKAARPEVEAALHGSP